MYQHPSTSGSCRLSKNNSTEDGIHDRSRCEAFTRNAVSSKKECKQLRLLKSLINGTKSVSVFQDSGYSSMSQELLSDENLSTLTAVDLNVNRRVEDIRKRRALKMRNILVEDPRPMYTVKVERNGKNGNLLSKRVDEGQSRSRIRVERVLKDQINGGNEELNGNETEWNGDVYKTEDRDEELDEDGDGTKWNRNILRGQGDIDKPNESKVAIKKDRNVVIDQSGGEELNGNGRDVEYGGSSSKSQGSGEELDGGGGGVECNGNDLINQNKTEESDRNGGQQNVKKHQNGEEETNNGFPRKTKTLGLLCRKFFLKVLENVDSGDDKINLETIACSMEVEKRRIYDVVNVMEALGAMEKSHKSFYTWKGLDNLPSTLYTLKMEADKEGIYEKVLMTQHIMTRFMEVPNKNGNADESPSDAGPSQTSDDSSFTAEQLNSPGNKNNGPVSSKQSGSKKKENKRQRGLNSLTYLCKYFFKILIVGLDYQADYKVSLDVASTILIKDPEIDGCKPPDRSRCRRIYDVANVLISLRLIERRMFTFGTKKIPLFVYCGPKIIENGKFDFFHHIRFNKLSVKLKNSEEKKAYEMEEENLEKFFLTRKGKNKETELSNDVVEPAEKRSRIEEIQENVDVDKENAPAVLVNQVIPPQGPMIVPIIRPQPQSVVQQPRFTQFMPLSISSQGFLPFDPNIMLLNNGGMLHNVNFPRIPMQQNNFNYLSVAYPLSPMAFFQQPRGPTIDTASTSYTAYNNTSNNFIHPVNTLRSSLFNIDSILGNGQIRGNNQVADEMRLATSIIQHSNPTGQNSLFQHCSNFLYNYSSIFNPNEKQCR